MNGAAAEENTSYKILTISAIQEEVPGFKTFSFKGAEAESIPYKAGQYLTFVHQTPHQEEVRRSYSIISSPALSEPLTIGIRRIENGAFSRLLVDRAQVGDTVRTTGAAGFFTLPEQMEPYRQVFLLAAGSGITPVFSILKTLLHQHQGIAIVLIYSNSSPESTIYLQKLRALEEQYSDRLQIEFLYSNSPNLARARLYKDLLQQLLKTYTRALPQQQLFYLCGPFNYMRMCYYALRQAGIPDDHIRKETFNTHTSPPKIAPPDTAGHRVELHLQNKVYSLTAQYPDTIFRAARKAGINLPYSCEAGKCGNCAARVLQGQVWMLYNEVLTDRQTQNGLTLTCVGYPVGGDVVLEIL